MNRFLNFPETISHVTDLDSLYPILRSGFLRSRAETGAQRGFSAMTKGDPNFIYLSLDSSIPPLGKVKLVLDSSLLIERNDYYLNIDWVYGVTQASLRPSQLGEWLESVQGPGEILFQNEIPLDKYLREVVVPQLNLYVMNLISQSNPHYQFPVLDINKIPFEYRDKVKIVYV